MRDSPRQGDVDQESGERTGATGQAAIGRSGGNSYHSLHNNRVASARKRFVWC